MKKEYRSFEEARKFVHLLNFQNSGDWKEYCKSGKKPDGIPSTPYRIYKKEWIDWKDFLGIDKKPSFKKARIYAQSLKLKTSKDWMRLHSEGKLPKNMPKYVNESFAKEGWMSWGDFLGTKKQYCSFGESKKFAHSLNLKTIIDWKKITKTKNFPLDIPKIPDVHYNKKKLWVSWSDFLGTEIISNQNRKFSSFDKAKKFARSLKLNTGQEWRIYCKSGNKPHGIPSNPARTYRKEWKGMGDFLGTGTIAPQNKEFWSYEKTSKYLVKHQINTRTKFRISAKGNLLPKEIPRNPERHYKKQNRWTSYGNFFGTGEIASYNKKFKKFEDTRKFVQSLNLNGWKEWNEYCQSGKKPTDIPSSPNKQYKNDGWKNYGDWLGTGIISVKEQSENYLTFDEARIEAREIAKKLGITSTKEWIDAHKKGKIPDYLPRYPYDIYRKRGNKK